MPAIERERDEKGRFVAGGGGGGLKAWADTKGRAPGLAKIAGGGLGQWAAAKVGQKGAPKAEGAAAGAGRTWTDKLPEGMKAETWMGQYDAHPDKGGKVTNPERQELHNAIMKEALAAAPAKEGEKKIAIMTMGAPASGKSSMLRGVDTSRFVKVDPDAIKEKLPEYQKATADKAATYKGAALMAHEESSHIAKQIMKQAIANGQHVIVDGTGSDSEKFIKKMEALKSAGYHVEVHMPHLDEEEGIKRMKERAGKSGRMVPEAFARKAYKDIPANFEKIAGKADGFKMYDQSGKAPRLVWEKSKAGGETHHDPAFVKAFREKYGEGK